MSRVAVGAGRVVGPAAHGEPRRGVRVHTWTGFWAGMSILRFPLRTRGGQERRERSRFQQTFGSLRALQGRCEEEEEEEKK